MDKKSADVVIIGGGLAGLALAYYLRSSSYTVCIIEARDRLGGRIYTDFDGGAPIEYGATWLGRKHTALLELLDELQLDTFMQELGQTAIYEAISTSPHQIVNLPPNTDPSFRIKGGTQALIAALERSLSSVPMSIGDAVRLIREDGESLSVETDSQSISAKYVVSTLPPHLLASTISVDPPLPDSFKAIAQSTHTWMGESIKVGLQYKTPIWKDKSATIVSNVGPIPEMYDHSNFENNQYALMGFFNGAYYTLSKENRRDMVLAQLRKYYGEDVDQYIAYKEMVWRNEPYTYTPYTDHVLPHQNNGHKIYQAPFLGGKLFVAGSETSQFFPGYMDGAVRSARYIADRLSAFG